MFFDRTKQLNELQLFAVRTTKKQLVGSLLELPVELRGYQTFKKPENNNFTHLEETFLEPGHYLIVDFVPVASGGVGGYPTFLYVVLGGEKIYYIDKRDLDRPLSK